MSFIKLSHMILNTRYIHTILKSPDKYHICINKRNTYGALMFGSGSICSDTTEIKICAVNHPNDYKSVTDWIEQQK